MNSAVRKWLAASALLGAAGLGIAGELSGGQDNAAMAARPSAPVVQQGQGKGLEQRHENAPPSLNGPAPLTGPASIYRPLEQPNWGDNVRANTDTQSPNLAQQEPSISVNPTNPLNVVAAAKDERAGANTKQIWIYTSTDGGQTWLNQIFPLHAPASPFSSDPVVNWSDDGICYVTALPYGGGAAGVQVSKSTDSGITFGPSTQVTNNGGADKEWTWVDNYPSSPYYHRVYVAWMDFSPGFRVTYSTNRGDTWTQSTVGQTANQFPMPIVLPNGNVLVTYRSSGGGVAYIRSTDGGVTFGTQQPISNMTAPTRPPGSVFRLSPVPAVGVNRLNGALVVTWADGTGGTSTVRYSRSTDNGVTWSPSAVLAPPGVAQTYQIEPWVEADEAGFWHAIWYDNRETPNTPTFQVYYSQSTDDGATWSTASRISTASSNLNIGIPSSYSGAAGDYINITASHGNVYGVWTDTRAGNGEDVYVVRGTYGSGGSPTVTVTGTPPTATPTRTSTLTPSPTATVCGNGYSYATATATIEPGTTDTLTNCDDCITTVNLPFPFTFYNRQFTTANISSNGNLQFDSLNSTYTANCPIVQMSYAMLPYFNDLRTDTTSCTPGPCGVFTSVSGTAPNRVFNVEWRATLFTGGASVNFEVRLYENSPQQFEYVYGPGAAAPGAAVGIGRDDATSVCYTGSLSPGLKLAWTPAGCGSVTVTPTGQATLTSTAVVSGTATNTAVPPSLTVISTGTVTRTNTPGGATSTATVAVTATACAITFTDVLPTDYFYQGVQYLYCHGAISGYADNTFRPYNDTTRGQLAKIIVLAEGFPINTSGAPHFTDVPSTNPFYAFIETAYNRGIVSGYADNTFRWGANVTRAQLSKIIVGAEGWSINTVNGPHFTDVGTTHPFYPYIETAYNRGIISGYADGTFRPSNNATRGQIAKIVYSALIQP